LTLTFKPKTRHLTVSVAVVSFLRQGYSEILREQVRPTTAGSSLANR
jgi:hypothetical protein